MLLQALIFVVMNIVVVATFVVIGNIIKMFITNFVKNGILDNQEGMDSATGFLTDFITNTAIKAGSQGTQIELTPSTQKTHPPGKKGVKKLGGKLCLSGMMKPV